MDNISAMLRQYELYVTEALDDHYNYETDDLLTLILRDGIEDRRSDLTREGERKLEELDEVLVRKRERLLDWAPSPNEHDRRRWWFLDEGPPQKLVD